MQSDPQKFDVSPSPPTLPQQSLSQQTLSPLIPAHPHRASSQSSAAYTPRTVWQTPHGLAPTFTARRGTRAASTDPVAALLRRCMRLSYRLRRVLATPPVSAGLGWGSHRSLRPS